MWLDVTEIQGKFEVQLNGETDEYRYRRRFLDAPDEAGPWLPGTPEENDEEQSDR